jgi:3-isopropylmalate/(R)-2-methylmalate dehydratase small subunit
MEPLRRLRGIGLPFDRDNVDTDQLIPGRFIMKPRDYDYAGLLFHDLRFGPRSGEGFILDTPPYQRASIMVTGSNFGCGSAREQAVYALQDFGLRALIGPSFGGIFYTNCIKNGVLPAIVDVKIARLLCEQLRKRPGAELEVDIESRTIVDVAGEKHPFRIEENDRRQLIEGKDDITRTLEHESRLVAFERAYQASARWTRASAREALDAMQQPADE